MAPTTFSMRIVSMDYYMSPPIPQVDVCYNPFQGQVVAEVPVIRIYGSTLGGQKTCLHIHQAFPYLYVPYDNDLPQNIEEGYAYVRYLASAIEKAMKLSSSIGAKRQHVHSCSLVRAKKFYGYRLSEQLFIKIVLYYPEEVSRVAALLLGGGILNHVFQPHESHIPYLLQFLIDHNLYGMGHIQLSTVRFRYPLPDGILDRACLFRDVALKQRDGGKELDDVVALDSENTWNGPESEQVIPSTFEYPKSSRRDGIGTSGVEADRETPEAVNNHSELWLRSEVPSGWLLSQSIPNLVGGSPCEGKHPEKRQSTCELEGDTTVQEILNQHQLMYIPLSQAGSEVKMVQSLLQLWEEEYLRTGSRMTVEKFGDRKPPAERVLKTLSHGQEYRNLISKLVAVDEQKINFLKSDPVTPSEKGKADQNRHEVKASPNGSNSGEGHIHDELVKFTQAANSKELTPRLPVNSLVMLQDAADATSMPSVGEQGLNVPDALVDEDFVRSQKTSTDLKDVDKEAIELLRWLASSQADSENKEDEEFVLSQLLCSDSIERVLEKAHSNYENASQKECKDILSSVEDLEDYIKGKSNHLGHPSQESIPQYVGYASLHDDVIPQLDGMWDDLVNNPRPTMLKEKKPRKKLKPIGNGSDNICRGVVTSSSSADESLRNKALWGSLPLARNGGDKNDSSTADSMSASEDNPREDKFSVNLGNIDELKEPSLRDQMRKKRTRRPDTLESEHLIAPNKMTMDRGTEHGVRCQYDMTILENAYQKAESISDDIYGDASKKCHVSKVSKDRAVIRPFELKECSEKHGNKMVDEKVSRFRPLRLVKQRTVDHHAEAYGQQHSEHVRRNLFNEETEVYLKSVTVGPEKDHEGKKWVQAEADHCGIQTEGLKNIYQEESDKKLEYFGSDHQNLAEEECSIVMEHFPLKKLVSNERTCGDITPCKELEEKAEAGPELQTCFMHASNGEDPRNSKKIDLRTQLTDVASESKCSSQCNSHGSGWESDHGWKQQIRPSENQARECQSDDLLDGIGTKEHLVEKRDLLGMHNSSVECQEGPREETPVNRHEKYLRVSGEKLQLSEKDDSHSIRPADTELRSLNLRDCVEDKLIPLAFHLKPPTKDQIKLGSGNGSLTSVEHGGVYYGNVEDVPDVPVVIAGLVFEVKSREVKYLRPFFLEKGQWRYWNERECMDKKMQDPCHGFETVMGIPMHYQNNGSALCLVTPVQPPPPSSAIIKWLSQVKRGSLGDVSEQQGIGSRSNSQVDDKQPNTVQILEATKMHLSSKQSTGLSSCFDGFDVASPKHDKNRASIIGSTSSSQCEETYCQLRQPASSGTNGFGNLNSLDKICSTIQSFNHRQFADGSSSSQEVGAHHILKEPSHENIPVSNPSKTLQNEKLRKETIHDKSPKIWRDVSQLSAPSPISSKQTPGSQTGFRDPASVGAGQQLTLMSIEIHAQSRGELTPDPRYDAINIIVAVIQEDFNQTKEVFVLMRDEKANACNRNIDGVLGCEVFAVNDEKTLFYLFIQLVRLYDPDILMGWEIQGGSLGFLAERAAYVGIGLLKKISRTPFFETKLGAVHSEDVKRSESKESVPEEFPAEALELHDAIIEDEWGRTHGSGIHVGGRIVLNLWRIMRGELNLGIYTLEAVAEAVLRRKIPSIPWCTLTRWFLSGPGRGRFRCIEYIVDRAQLNLAIMDQMDMINRTSELARVFGIDFFSVLSRGSQYRVESMMLRLTHTQNFLVISPSKQQVASQPAMECLPLVMEPESRFYTDPVVVLDFQSLYPSMIIAYNLCFSTCLGKVMAGNNKILGVTSYTPDICLSEMEDRLFITPNGVMFVPPEVCRGVLPRLLQEILSTRIMVKNAMKKLLPTQKVLQRVLNARQLALKLIANVTYGYTAAGFSGRMPCAEIADSIVQCGRRTLENAINFVNSNSEWNARVVYGDTDSMFVLLKGRTREEAFRIGQEIASAITAKNPQPVTLKMEKVYHPCVLLTKKRYVGYSYESHTQSKPIFDAKGIETIRRDSCPAVAKILERSLRILFESHDLSQVKSYLYRQWRKIISGRVSLQDFIFAKEVRLGTYSMKASSLPPAAIVATKSMRVDPRAEPRYGERVRYVVIHGEPGARLADMVVDPLELLDINTPHRLHDTYYITKQIIPSLQRVFGLVGVDLKSWYSEMPRPVRPMIAKRRPNVSPSRSRHSAEGNDAKKYQKGPPNRSTIDHYYLSQHCVVCGELIRGLRFLCDHCSVNRCISALTMIGRTSRLEKEIEHLDAICRHCGGGDGDKEIKCTSLDCPVFYERRKVQKELLVVSQVSTESGFYPPCMVELF